MSASNQTIHAQSSSYCSENLEGHESSAEDPSSELQQNEISVSSSKANDPNSENRADPAVEFCLYDKIHSHGSTLQDLSKKWLNQYESNRSEAFRQILEMLLICTGKRRLLSLDGSQCLKLEEILSQHAHIYSGEQFILWEEFEQKMLSFLKTIIINGCANLPYDKHLVNFFFTTCKNLTSSNIKAFRHTGACTVISVVEAYITVYQDLSQKYSVNKRQLEAERKKPRDRFSVARLEKLSEAEEELNTNMTLIQRIIETFSYGMFKNLLSDVMPSIRLLCVVSMGTWLKIHDFEYFNTYIQAILSQLVISPLNGEIRIQSLKVLLDILKTPSFNTKMKPIAEFHKNDIVSLILDKNVVVAEYAIKVCTEMFRLSYDEEEDTEKVDNIFTLIFSKELVVAKAAGQFLLSILDRNQRKQFPKSSSTKYLVNLVDFYLTVSLPKVPNKAAMLVGAIFTHENTRLTDWKEMMDLIVNHSESLLSGMRLVGLMELMSALAKLSCLGENITLTGSRKVTPTKKMSMQMLRVRKSLTKHCLPHFPELICKYRADEDKVEFLASLPQCFFFTTITNEFLSIEDMIKNLIEGFAKLLRMPLHSHVFMECSKSLKTLSFQGNAYRHIIAPVIGIAMDSMVSTWKEQLECYIALEDKTLLDENDKFKMELHLKAMSMLYEHHNLRNAELQQLLLTCFLHLKNQVEESEDRLLEVCAQHCLHALLLDFVWCAQDVDRNQVLEILALDDRIKIFIDVLMETIANFNVSELQKKAFEILCSMLLQHIFFRGKDALNIARLNQEQSEVVKLFVDGHIFTKPGDDERPYTQELIYLEKRRLLILYCKLFFYKILPIEMLYSAFAQLPQFEVAYGSILCSTFGHLKIQLAQPSMAAVVICTLTHYFDTHKIGAVEDHQSEKFWNFKWLAKKLASYFPVKPEKFNTTLSMLHRGGINFALCEPNNILFLEALAFLSNKLCPKTKKEIIKYLGSTLAQRRIISKLSEAGKDAIVTYKKSLCGQYPLLPGTVPPSPKKAKTNNTLISEDSSPQLNSNLSDLIDGEKHTLMDDSHVVSEDVTMDSSNSDVSEHVHQESRVELSETFSDMEASFHGMQVHGENTSRRDTQLDSVSEFSLHKDSKSKQKRLSVAEINPKNCVVTSTPIRSSDEEYNPLFKIPRVTFSTTSDESNEQN